MKKNRKTQTLVKAVDCVVGCLEEFPESLVSDEMMDRLYGTVSVPAAEDDARIGGRRRQLLATLLRDLRAVEGFREEFSRRVRSIQQKMRKNPHRWFVDAYPPRLYPQTVTRKARSPKSHRDCAYCGCGLAGISVCGICRENGIDGPVIRGTEGSAAVTYQIWKPRKRGS